MRLTYVIRTINAWFARLVYERDAWDLNKQLPENLPASVVRQLANLPLAQQARLLDTLGLQPTGLFDSHPSNGDRIRRSRRANLPGLFQRQEPATILFSDFSVVARQVTILHYTEELGIPRELIRLMPVKTSAPEITSG